MKLITSKNNSLYREIRQLASSAQARRKSTRTILDGIHLCQSYLEYVGNPLFCIVNESAKNTAEVAEIIKICLLKKVSCLLLPEALYKGLSQVQEGVGILFIIEPISYSLPQKIRKTCVLLDRIQDPGNLGSILRSASAAGISEVYCSKGTALAWTPRVLRAGMGAHFMIHVHENVDLEKLIDQSAVPVIATALTAKETLYECDLKTPVAWLFGHEGQGISERLLSKADMKVRVPHAGRQDSLNVAACAAVCFFEQLRQKI